MTSLDNLQTAFAGESQANRKYLAFADQAEKDGLPQTAKLFRAAVEAETVHALAHLRAMGGLKTTAENLQAAIGGEAYEFQKMYPPFVQQARQEANQAALTSFKNALAVEEIHHRLYSQASQAVKAGKDFPPTKVFVCRVCGNTVCGGAPDKCPVCGSAREKFREVF
ncbi:MAG: rubrerythrin family protein [Phycisphaerae bacterium]|jgi:rubrerythrin